jgi:hypothetical protein
MKKSSLLALALVALGFTGSAFAGTGASCKCNPTVLRVAPAKVVSPTDLPSAFADKTVKVEFSLDQNGQPRDIRVNATDRVLTRQLVRAFREWKFEGDVQQASASGQRFVLPLKLVG